MQRGRRGVLQALNPLHTVWHLPRLSQGRTQGKQNVVKTLIHFTRLLKINHSPPIYRYISEMVADRWVYAARRLTSIESSVHPTFTAIFPEAYPGEAKMCLRLSSQMPYPQIGCRQRHIPAWLSWGSQIMCLRLIAETDARSVGEPSFLYIYFLILILMIRSGKHSATWRGGRVVKS